MRFWLFGTFIIIWAAVLVYLGGVWGTGLALLGQANFWIAFVVTAVLCVAWYYLYKWITERNK
jgi:hypothetical protein